MDETNKELASALARVIGSESNPRGWVRGGDFPWHEPEFGRRALVEHLDDSHPAAPRPPEERTRQIDWLIDEIGLIPGQRVLDVACGPGLYSLELARRGFEVVGIDINPAAIEFARVSAEKQGLEARCASSRLTSVGRWTSGTDLTAHGSSTANSHPSRPAWRSRY